MERFPVFDKFKNCFHINKALLPMKLIYFFLFGGISGVLPFITLVAKQIGINAAAVGIGHSVIPVFILLCNPIVGLLVDYFQNIKVFLIVFVLSSGITHFSVLSLPPITHKTDNVTYVQVFIHNDSEPLLNISTPFQRSCLDEIIKTGVRCELELEHVNVITSNNGIADISSSINITFNYNDTGNNGLPDRRWIHSYVVEPTSLPDDIQERNSASLRTFRCYPNILHCSISVDSTSVYSTYQFWTFITLVIVGGMAWVSCMTLCCVACCEVLGTDMEHYGRQRMFGTISTGVIASAAGILNDKLAPEESSYLPGFYLMAIFLTVATIILSLSHLPKTNVSTNMCVDIRKIFTSSEIVVFSMGVTLIGFLATIISMYEFWFLQDMGSNQTLLGLSIATQSLLGEVPFLFFSGWFVNNFGHFLCLAIAFAGFVIRFLLYSILKDPWLVLPIDLLHGLTYGVYHGAMASFVKAKSPKGMEATLLGFYAGLYCGLGHGLGSLVGGFGLDKLGSRKTFFVSGVLSSICLLLYLVASYVFRASNRRKTPQEPPQEMVEMLQNE